MISADGTIHKFIFLIDRVLGSLFKLVYSPPHVAVHYHHLMRLFTITTSCGCSLSPPHVAVYYHHLMWLFTITTSCGCSLSPPHVAVHYHHLMWLFTITTSCGCSLSPPHVAVHYHHLMWLFTIKGAMARYHTLCILIQIWKLSCWILCLILPIVPFYVGRWNFLLGSLLTCNTIGYLQLLLNHYKESWTPISPAFSVMGYLKSNRQSTNFTRVIRLCLFGLEFVGSFLYESHSFMNLIPEVLNLIPL